MQHSHLFHVESRAIISSVVSDVDVRRRSLKHNDEVPSLLDIDVSSNRLDDTAVASLLEELLQMLTSKVYEADDSNAPLLIKLALAMNKITPVGASNILDILTNKAGVEDGEVATEISNGTLSLENVDASNPVVPNADDISQISNGLNNDSKDEKTVVDTITSTETSHCAEEDATKSAIQKPVILIEELDLSFNDIGGHGINPPNVQLLESVRRLFEGCGSAPRILSLENCGIGPAFCRSVGRVSIVERIYYQLSFIAL